MRCHKGCGVASLPPPLPPGSFVSDFYRDWVQHPCINITSFLPDFSYRYLRFSQVNGGGIFFFVDVAAVNQPRDAKKKTSHYYH